MENEKFLELEGYANDLLMVDGKQGMKSTRLLWFENLEKEDSEIIDVCITSTNCQGENGKFDELLDKRIKVTVEIID